MPKYIVRLWVDIEVKANHPLAAKEVAKKCKVGVDQEVYDIQTAEIWEKGGGTIRCTCIGEHVGPTCPFHGVAHGS